MKLTAFQSSTERKYNLIKNVEGGVRIGDRVHREYVTLEKLRLQMLEDGNAILRII